MPASRIVARLLVPIALTVSCDDDEPRQASTSGPLPPDGGAPCAPGELDSGDGCVAAGLPADMPPCPPGETSAEAGGCLPAGVPPDACGDGFAPQDGGCVAVMPAAACADGEMALPGDRACQEVAPCADGPWGDIPVDPTTQYVDGSYAGGDSDGTSTRPWTSIQDGIDAAPRGGLVAVAAGVYAENVVIAGDPVTLWGRCPRLVEIAGVSTTDSAIFVLAGAHGAEIRNVAVTGPSLGVTVSGANDVTLDGVWVHGTGERGINVEDTQGRATVAVRRALVEDAHFLGIANVGSSVDIEQTVVRRTAPLGAQSVGRGILVQASDKHRASAAIRRSVVRSNHEYGISIVGADTTVDSSLVIDTQPSGGTGFGIGIAGDVGDNARSTVTVASSVIQGNHTSGLLAYGSDVTIDATVVRDTLPSSPGDAQWGRGVYADSAEATGERTKLSLTRSLVDRNHDVGVFVAGSEAILAATLVRGTLVGAGQAEAHGINAQYQPLTGHRARVVADGCVISANEGAGVVALGSDLELQSTVVADTLPAADATGGSGVAIVPWEDGTPRSSAVIHACLVERNRHSGILAGGSDITVEATIVRDTAPEEDGHFGWGLELRAHSKTGQRAVATVRSSVVEASTQVGVVVEDADVGIESSIVRDVRAGVNGWGAGIVADDGATEAERTRLEIRGSIVENTLGFGVEVLSADAVVEGTRITGAAAIDGHFGDGLGIAAFTAPATAVVTRTLVENSGRAGITVFGGQLTLGSTTSACNPIDIAAEVLEVGGGAPAIAPTFDDLGDNLCGCQGTTLTCAAETVGLEPPGPTVE